MVLNPHKMLNKKEKMPEKARIPIMVSELDLGDDSGD